MTPPGPRHLQLEVGVVGDSHELRIVRSSQDGMAGSMEPNHFEGEGLRPIVGRTPEGDGQIGVPKWHGESSSLVLLN